MLSFMFSAPLRDLDLSPPEEFPRRFDTLRDVYARQARDVRWNFYFSFVQKYDPRSIALKFSEKIAHLEDEILSGPALHFIVVRRRGHSVVRGEQDEDDFNILRRILKLIDHGFAQRRLLMKH